MRKLWWLWLKKLIASTHWCKFRHARSFSYTHSFLARTARPNIQDMSSFESWNSSGKFCSWISIYIYIYTSILCYSQFQKVLSDERLGAKLRVTENRCVLFDSFTYIYPTLLPQHWALYAKVDSASSFIYIYIYIYISLSIYQSIYLLVYLSIYLYIYI